MKKTSVPEKMVVADTKEKSNNVGIRNNRTDY